MLPLSIGVMILVVISYHLLQSCIPGYSIIFMYVCCNHVDMYCVCICMHMYVCLCMCVCVCVCIYVCVCERVQHACMCMYTIGGEDGGGLRDH